MTSLPFLNEYPYHMRIVLSRMLICSLADDVIEVKPDRMLWWVLRLLAVFTQYLFNLSFC